MPGELVAKEGSDAKGGYYTPIAGELDQGFKARPIFYGMYLANQLAGTQSKEVSLTTNGVDATAYAGQKEGQLKIALFNKDQKNDLRLVIEIPQGFKMADVWRLTAPHLDSTSGVMLAGAEMPTAGTWSPTDIEAPAINADRLTLDLPKTSAALLFLNS